MIDKYWLAPLLIYYSIYLSQYLSTRKEVTNLLIKLNIVITDKNDKDGTCNVKVEMPKNLDKASDNEKGVALGVYQIVSKALKNESENQK